MAVSVSTLTTWRDRLQESVVSGVLEVQDQNGERVRYRSQAELQQALASVNRMILAVTLGSQPVTEIRFRTSKGI
jgi:hypothetical protein